MMTCNECFDCHTRSLAMVMDLGLGGYDFKATLAPEGSRCMCGEPAAIQVSGKLAGRRCRGCSAALWPENFDKIADGCPCNTPRGSNHGIVPRKTCTCDLCDQAQTGSVRK